MLIKVLKIGLGFWIFVRIQALKQLFKSLSSLLDQLLVRLVVSGVDLLQSIPGEVKDGDISKQRPKGLLLLYSWTTIGEKHFQLPIIQLVFKIMTNRILSCIDPEPNRFKGTTWPFRSQGPAHLFLPQIFTSRPLQMRLGRIHYEKPIGHVLHRRPPALSVSNLAKPSVGRTLTRSLSPDPPDFTAGLCTGKVNGKTNTRFQSFSLILPVGHQRQLFCQGNEGFFPLPIDHLNHTIPKRSEVCDQFPHVRLMPVEYVASRMFATKLVYDPFFQGLEYVLQQRIKNL
jgi:hypothetical protein